MPVTLTIRRGEPWTYTMEAEDDEGGILQVTFSGPDAEVEARDYARTRFGEAEPRVLMRDGRPEAFPVQFLPCSQVGRPTLRRCHPSSRPVPRCSPRLSAT